MMQQSGEKQGPNSQVVKIAFGMAALLSVAVGLALYLFADAFGLDQETAQWVAVAFLIAGFGDYIMLRYWDRMQAMKRKREGN
ncbi:MAG: hypothetical protein VX871_00215 [Pseudomonadota bacterium]|nr:hypothetical protein [Pseudomonadota bacterium]